MCDSAGARPSATCIRRVTRLVTSFHRVMASYSVAANPNSISQKSDPINFLERSENVAPLCAQRLTRPSFYSPTSDAPTWSTRRSHLSEKNAVTTLSRVSRNRTWRNRSTQRTPPLKVKPKAGFENVIGNHKHTYKSTCYMLFAVHVDSFHFVPLASSLTRIADSTHSHYRSQKRRERLVNMVDRERMQFISQRPPLWYLH